MLNERTFITKQEKNVKRILQKDKKALFRQIRKAITPKITNDNPINLLLANQDVENCLLNLETKVRQGNAYYQVMLMIDKGVILFLIDFLQRGIYVNSTLKLFATIISKESVRVGNMLVNRGFLELIVRYMKDKQNFMVCCNIIGNLAIQDYNLAQMMMQNRIEKLLINHILKIIQEETNKEIIQFGLWAIVNICSMRESNLNFQDSYRDLGIFSNILLSKDIEVQRTLQIIYQLGCKDKVYVKTPDILSSLNRLLYQASPTASYLKHLFHVLNLLVALQIDYGPFYSLMLMNPQYIPLNLKTLFELSKFQKGNNYCDQSWWEKLIYLAPNISEKELILKIGLNYNIYKMSWIWIVLTQLLSLGQQIKYKIEGLKFIHSILKNPKQEIKRMIEIYGIQKYLSQLTFSPNITIQNKAQQILSELTINQ